MCVKTKRENVVPFSYNLFSNNPDYLPYFPRLRDKECIHKLNKQVKLKYFAHFTFPFVRLKRRRHKATKFPEFYVLYILFLR